jgi:hypothetical protein
LAILYATITWHCVWGWEKNYKSHQSHDLEIYTLLIWWCHLPPTNGLHMRLEI